MPENSFEVITSGRNYQFHNIKHSVEKALARQGSTDKMRRNGYHGVVLQDWEVEDLLVMGAKVRAI